MKTLARLVFVVFLISSRSVFAQPCTESYSITFDENGNGFQNHYHSIEIDDGGEVFIECTNEVTPLAVQVGPDPSSGVTGHSVLIYTLPANLAPVINSGDVAIVSSNSSIKHLIRFLGGPANPNNQVVFYAADNSGSLADSGIPTPSVGAVSVSENLAAGTSYNPGQNGPGGSIFLLAPVTYRFFTEPVSPPFVLSTNRLYIALGSNEVTVSWSTNATNFGLYQAGSPVANNWTVVTNTPATSNDANFVTLPVSKSDPPRFFRLKAQ